MKKETILRMYDSGERDVIAIAEAADSTPGTVRQVLHRHRPTPPGTYSKRAEAYVRVPVTDTLRREAAVRNITVSEYIIGRLSDDGNS